MSKVCAADPMEREQEGLVCISGPPVLPLVLRISLVSSLKCRTRRWGGGTQGIAVSAVHEVGPLHSELRASVSKVLGPAVRGRFFRRHMWGK